MEVLDCHAGRTGIGSARRAVALLDPRSESGDFGWPDLGVLREFDGKSKYGELMRRPGQSAEQVLVAEKRREDRLRELGWMVIRWMWQDLIRPEELIGRLRTAFSRGRQMD